MREALKKLTSESLVYGLGQVSGRAVQLLLVPVLTWALLPGAYAISDLAAAYLQTAVLVLVFGMDGALARFFYSEPDREARIRMVSTSLVFRVVASLLAAALLALFAGPLAAQLMGGVVYRKYVLIVAATLPFTLLVVFANEVLRVTFQPWKFIALNVTQTVVVAGVSLWLVLGRHLGVAGVLYGRLAGDGLCALLGLLLIRHALRPRFAPASLRRMLAYGLPLVPVAFAYGAITSIDRYVLQRTRTLEEVATYAVAMKFFAVVTMGLSAFQLAYGPFAYARAGTAEAPRLYARVLSAFLGLATLGAMTAGLFAPEIVAVLARRPGYEGAAGPAVWLSFAAVAQGAYTVTAVGIGLALKTPLLGLCAGAAAVTALGANLLLTPRLGPAGAAAATMTAHAVSAVLTYRLAQRVHPLPYRGARLAAVACAGLALTLAVQHAAHDGVAYGLARVATLGLAALAMTRLGLWTERGAVAPSSSGVAGTGEG